jgi:hypothetical protein
LVFKFACCYECPGKPDGTAIEWDASAAVYANDVNLLGHNINIIKKSTEALIDAIKEVGLEINAEETKYMLMSRHQHAGQNHDLKRANRFFENVAQFKYLWTTITSQNLIQEEIKRRLNSGNSVQKLSSFRLSRNVKIRTYKLYFCLRFCVGVDLEGHMLRVF